MSADIIKLVASKTLFIFDFDHTIGLLDADHVFDWAALFNSVESYFKEEFNVEIPENQTLLLKIENLMRLALDKVPNLSKQDIFKEVCKIIKDNTIKQGPRTIVFSCTGELFKYLLENDKKIAICSHNNRDIIEKALERSDLLGYISGIWGLEDSWLADLSIKPLGKIVEKFGATSKDALFFGDHKMDVVAARRFGIDIICLLSGHSSLDNMLAAGAKYIFNNLEEFWLKLKEKSS
ncbi:MAG: HAD family hydrolase [Promethearchaeota archaeon]